MSHSALIGFLPCNLQSGLQVIGNPLGNSRPWSYDELHVRASMAQHGHQGIHAEAVDLASHKIADAGLTDAKQAGSLGLGEPTRFDHLTEFDHELSAQLEVLGFLWREPQIAEHVAGGPANLGWHNTPTFLDETS